MKFKTAFILILLLAIPIFFSSGVFACGKQDINNNETKHHTHNDRHRHNHKRQHKEDDDDKDDKVDNDKKRNQIITITPTPSISLTPTSAPVDSISYASKQSSNIILSSDTSIKNLNSSNSASNLITPTGKASTTSSSLQTHISNIKVSSSNKVNSVVNIRISYTPAPTNSLQSYSIKVIEAVHTSNVAKVDSVNKIQERSTSKSIYPIKAKSPVEIAVRKSNEYIKTNLNINKNINSNIKLNASYIPIKNGFITNLLSSPK